MLVLRDDFSSFTGQTVLTIGKFDGLHLGHQALIRLVRDRATALGVQAGLVTFDPHPAAVLRPEGAPPLITPLPDKLQLLERWGLDVTAIITFTPQVAQMRAAVFLEYLERGLHPRAFVVGPDFRFGHRREGTVEFLRAWAAERQIEVHVVPPVLVDGEHISGSRIRELIAQGAVEAAARFLGRPFGMSGEVVVGDRRGHQIGIPTANIQPQPDQVVPANGVYVTLVEWNQALYPAVTNVGVRPTVDGRRRQVESHILEWSGELYGKRITVYFLHRLRSEQKFSSVAHLVEQIRRDIQAARAWLTAQKEVVASVAVALELPVPQVV